MSNLVKHAINELQLAKLQEVDCGDIIKKNVLDLIRTLSWQGHSGGSISMVLPIFLKLASFDVLTPLTGNADEWQLIEDELFQNKRFSRVFMQNGQAYDVCGRVFEDLDGTRWTNAESRVDITFPYYPKQEIVKRS